MKKRVRTWIARVLLCLVLLLMVHAMQVLFTPKYVEYGANFGPYLAEERDSLDVLFLGSSVVYCNIVPSIVAEELQCGAYVLAGPEQTIAQTYYYLQEAFKTQSPQVVALELSAMFFPQYTNYSKVVVGTMPWSFNRLGATFNAVEPEERMGLLFPLYNYHDRWSSLTARDIQVFFRGYDRDPLAGHTFLHTAVSIDGVAIRDNPFDEAVYLEHLSWLHKIAAACRAQGSSLVVYMAPSYLRASPEHLARMDADLKQLDAVWLNMIDDAEQIGLDKTTDFYDNMHLNCYGAETFSRYVAAQIAPMRADAAPQSFQAADWAERTAHFYRLQESVAGDR